MKKLFSNIILGGLFITTLAVFIGSTALLHPQIALADTAPAVGKCTFANGNMWGGGSLITYAQCKTYDPLATWVADPNGRVEEKTVPSSGCGITNLTSCILLVPGYIASYVILPLVGWITTLSGLLLNFITDMTIVHMKDNIAKANINATWSTVRDVANMFFIFVLLYTAIMTMFGKGDYKKTISNLVIAAILINFSLFFTKVIIDAGNLLALTFYNAIVSPAASVTGASHFDTGISNALMNQLHVSSIWSSKGGLIDGTKLVTIGIMGSLVALIAAFVFLTISIMFVIRFVVLIFVLILSPLMFAGLILPNMKKIGTQWWDALIGQTFFAPIYFFMMWIVIKLSQGLFAGSTGDLGDTLGNSISATHQLQLNDSNFGVLINFVMIIAFLILALVVSKNYSNKAGGLVASATKWATGYAGGATFGMAGRLGRGTIGRAGAAISESEALKDAVAKGGVSGRLARLSLAAGNKTAGASFDGRGSFLGKTLDAGKPQKGGFAADLKAKVKSETDYAKSLGPTDRVKEQAQVAEDKATEALTQARAEAEKTVDTELPKPAELATAETSLTELKKAKPANVREETWKDDIKRKEEEVNNMRKTYETERTTRINTVVSTHQKTADEARAANTKVKGARNERMRSYAQGVEEQKTLGMKFDIFGRILGRGPVKRENLAAATAIRKEAKEKTPKEKAEAAALDYLKSEEEKKKAESGDSEAKSEGESKPDKPEEGEAKK